MSSDAPTLRKSCLKVRRVRLRQQRHRSRAEGRRPKNRPYEKGDDSDPGLASRRGCVLTANASRPEAVGWAPLVLAGPLTTSLRGLWVSGLPATVQWWSECWRSGDPKTDQVTQGADSELPGWQPKENATSLPHKEDTLKSAWVATAHRVVKEPRSLPSRRHWLLQVVASTAGRRLAMAAVAT